MIGRINLCGCSISVGCLLFGWFVWFVVGVCCCWWWLLSSRRTNQITKQPSNQTTLTMLSLRDEFGIVRIFRESRCKDTKSQKLILGLGLFRCEKVGKKWFRWVSLGFRVYNIYNIYIIFVWRETSASKRSKMSKVKTNIVPPRGKEYTLYIYINKVFF